MVFPLPHIYNTVGYKVDAPCSPHIPDISIALWPNHDKHSAVKIRLDLVQSQAKHLFKKNCVI